MKPYALLTLFMVMLNTDLTAMGAQPAEVRPITVPRQPMLAQLHRLTEAMEVVGNPFNAETKQQLMALKSEADDARVVSEIQRLLDPLCIATVDLQPSGPPVVNRGAASTELLEQGWRTFLVKVINKPGATRRLLVESPNAQPLPHAPANEVQSRWMQLSTFEGQPMRPNLSGLELEYRILQIYSRDPGAKQAILEFAVSSQAGDDSELIREWRFTEDTDGWRAMNQTELEVRDGALQVTSTGEDPFMGADVEGRSGPMMLRFWAKTDHDGIGQFFWWTKDIPQATADRQTNFVLEPGKEHLYEVPFHVEGTLGTLEGHYELVRQDAVVAGRGFQADESHHAERPVDLTLARYDGDHGLIESRIAPAPHPGWGFHRNLADHLLLGEPLAVRPEESRDVVAVLEAGQRSGANGGELIEIG